MFHVKHSVLMENLQSCPTCQAVDFKPFLDVKDLFLTGELFSLNQCNQCSLVFTNPRPPEKDASRYYQSEEYISHSNTNKGLVNQLYKLVRNYSLQRKVKLVKKYIPSGQALDIGCGTGHFLDQLSKNDFAVQGVEPGKEARQFARQQFNLSVESNLDNLLLKSERYQVISMWHVLEHVYSLDSYIARLKELLAHDGLLIVAVPNPESYDAKSYGEFWAAYDVPRHLYHFSQKSILHLFSKHQFDLIEIAPMKFDSYYISLLSEKYRSGSNNYFSALFGGLQSNLYAKRNHNNYSSLIYLFKSKIS